MKTRIIHPLIIILMIFNATGLSAKETEYKLNRLTPSVNPKLLDFQQQTFLPARLIKMGNRVQMAFGHSYANFTFIEGDDGVIMVDTGFFTNDAKATLAEYRNQIDKPIVAIIYTHTHNDHRGGSPVFTKDGNKEIPIYAPYGWQDRLDYDTSDQMELIKNRGMSQFGILLPPGKTGSVGTGIGPVTSLNGISAFALPTHTVPKTGMTVTISGVKMVFIPTTGDIESHMMIWLPDDKVMLSGDILGGTLPYVSTARFEPERDARKMAASMDKLMAYPAEYVIPGHGRPLIGTAEIRDVVLANRDASLFLADQITRYSRKSYTPDAIIDILQLPPHLANHPDLQPHYHKLAWLIRGMYLKRGGWGKNTLALVRHTDSEEARRMVKLLGGVDKVVKYAIIAFEEADYPWATQLAHQALLVEPSHQLATEVKIEALRGIAYSTESANERNYALTKVAEMAGRLPWGKVYSKVGFPTRSIQPSSMLLELLRVRFKAEDALDLEMTLAVTVEGETGGHSIELRKGILIYKNEHPKQTDAQIVIARDLLVKLSIGVISWSDALQKEQIRVADGLESVKQFVKLIDTLD